MKNKIKALVTVLFLLTSIVLMSQTTDKTSKTERYVDGLLEKASSSIRSEPNKAFLYLNEALKYKSSITEKQLLKLYNTTAIAYSANQSHLLALDYYYKSLQLQKKIGEPKLFFTYNNIGGVYMELGDTLKAKKFWTASLTNLKKNISKGNVEEKNVEAYLVYNNLALIEKGEKNYWKALQMLHVFKKNSLRLKDTAGIIIGYQNLSSVYEKLKEQDSSIFYLNKGIFLSKKIKSPIDLTFLYYAKGVNLQNIKNDSASYYLQSAFDLAGENDIKEMRLSAARDLAALYKSKNDFQKAYEYLDIANSLSETNISLRNNKKIGMLELEYEQKMKQQQTLLQTQKRESFLIFSFILLVPVLIIVFLMYRLQRTKSIKRKVEIELLIQKMEAKNKELTSNAIQMLQTSQRIDVTKKELNELKAISDSPTKKMLDHIVKDLKNGNHSFNRNEFEKLFMETDEVFYKKLLQKHPTLTKNEIRLCAFAKLNFSTKEISAVTQQSTSSILMARSRLRKKMGLTENSSLTNFLKGL